jgi:hypothetical protein
MSEKNTAVIVQQSVTASKARARVNRFLFSQVGTQFCSGEAVLEADLNQWRVPILMVTPGFIAGQVGEAIVSSQTRELLNHTEIEKMYSAAAKLRKKYGTEIEAAFLQTRNG